MYLGCKFYLFLQLCDTGGLLHGQSEGPPPCTGHLRLHPPHLFQFAFFAQETCMPYVIRSSKVGSSSVRNQARQVTI